MIRRVGGARWPPLPTLPSRPGTLVLGNHQSLFDIPLLSKCVHKGYALFVTRRRYVAKRVPLVTHMLRLYGHPIVDPGSSDPHQLVALRETAEGAGQPIVLFPEGHRSRDGEVGPFKTAGLRVLLGARRWTVYVSVVDGFWRCAQLRNFVNNVHAVRGRAEILGPMDSPAPGEDPGPFIEEVRRLIVARLRDMREGASALPPEARVAETRELARKWVLPSQTSAEVRALVEGVTAGGGPSLVGLILFGSRLAQTSPGRHSAYDFFVIVDDYGSFYRGLRAAGKLSRPPALVAFLNRQLPPNVISFRLETGLQAKLAVLTEQDLERALSDPAPDHFVLGRLSQRVELVWARNDAIRQRLFAAVLRAWRSPLAWAGPFMPASFTAEEFCRQMLAVSYAGEIRPEDPRRADDVAGAQADFFREMYGRLLEEAAAAGILAREGDRFRFGRPWSRAERRRRRAYFRRSKFRATLRWAKYMVTFEDWLDYLVRKVERRTGLAPRITVAERRLPLLLLWPKAIRVLWMLRRKDKPWNTTTHEA